MIKKTKILSVLAAAVLSATMFTACGSDDSSAAGDASKSESKGGKNITVISREDGSGTRGAFIELTGVEEKDADGNKSDKTTVDALIFKSTDVVLTQVAGDPNSIGYVSLGSINDTVKALKVDGVEPTVENVENGTYTIVRPFNIVVKDDLSDAAKDFQSYILSKEGQEVIADKYIAIDNSAAEYKATGAKGKVVVAGSSSVFPIMEKVAEEFMKVNSDITVEVQSSDSSTGVKSTIDGTCDIGMASRELKDTETSEGVQGVEIAKDAIAMIVNNDNDIADISIDNIRKIFIGETTSWDDVK